MAADAGFDSEPNHQLARAEWGIQSLIPASQGRPHHAEPTSRYRKQMKRHERHLEHSRCGQRWQVETVNSMIKRLTGDVVQARSYWSRSRLLTFFHASCSLAKKTPDPSRPRRARFHERYADRPYGV